MVALNNTLLGRSTQTGGFPSVKLSSYGDCLFGDTQTTDNETDTDLEPLEIVQELWLYTRCKLIIKHILLFINHNRWTKVGCNIQMLRTPRNVGMKFGLYAPCSALWFDSHQGPILNHRTHGKRYKTLTDRDERKNIFRFLGFTLKLLWHEGTHFPLRRNLTDELQKWCVFLYIFQCFNEILIYKSCWHLLYLQCTLANRN